MWGPTDVDDSGLTMNEAIRITPVGGGVSSAKQRATLREMSKRRNVSVRVVPSDVGPHRGKLGAFLALEFSSAPSVVTWSLLDPACPWMRRGIRLPLRRRSPSWRVLHWVRQNRLS